MAGAVAVRGDRAAVQLDNPPRDKLQKKLLIAERALADLDAWSLTGSALHA